MVKFCCALPLPAVNYSSMPDKYTATWTSHSSISDFLQCPRAYYLKNVYRDPKANAKVKLMTPALALGSAVHEALESLSVVKTDERFNIPLQERFEMAWKKVGGKQGGFLDDETENQFKNRGREMIRRANEHRGPLERLAVKIKKELPYFWLSEEDNIILCGRIDWLEYLKESDSVHIIDFKTGKNKEKAGSLQLPIYLLLVKNCQGRAVSKASYWYLATDDAPLEQPLPDEQQAHAQVLEVARKIKLARQLKKFDCPQGQDGCFACRDMEAIIAGKAELVGEDDFGAQVYILKEEPEAQSEESIIL